MIKSMNKVVDFDVSATSHNMFTNYGKIIVGDVAFEFYNEKNVQDYIQIPWSEIDYISASVMFRKYITRFVIFTYTDGKFVFSSRDNKALLRAVSKYIASDDMLRSKVFEVVRDGIKSLFERGRLFYLSDLRSCNFVKIVIQ